MNNFKEQGLRRCRHSSSYFRGAYNKYGRYQWDVKCYRFNDEYEIEIARDSFFGYKNELIGELLGRPVDCWFDGRMGGWFVIETELTEEELQKVDEFIEEVMNGLPKFLRELRTETKENE
jgi:hypothetical protein